MRKTLAIVALAGFALVAMIGGGGSAAAKMKRADCGYKTYGSTYVYSIKAKKTGCDTARSVAKKFTKCRKNNGGANGHCNRAVKGYNCEEDRYDKSDFQYSSEVVCKNGDRKVKFQYTQNT
jgi:hypothetical protein